MYFEHEKYSKKRAHDGSYCIDFLREDDEEEDG